jgi:hypothetical protein
MSLEGRQLQNYIIGKRIADKARAPLLTPARNALKKATAKLYKQCGTDVEIQEITPERRHGGRFTAFEALMGGQAVTLQAWRCTRAGVDIFDGGDHEMVGEIVVQLDMSKVR